MSKKKTLERLLSEARADLAVAKATAKEHVRAAAKFIAKAEREPAPGLRERAAEAQRLALRWRRKADHLEDWVRAHPFVEYDE